MKEQNNTFDINNAINGEIYNGIKMGTNIISGSEYRESLYSISNLAAEMVVQTLGPYGQTTIIDNGIMTYPTKDGWNAINKLKFGDPMYNTLFNVLKQISFDIVTKVGDGTTTALIVANAFLKCVLEYQSELAKSGATFRQVDFLNELNVIKDEIIDRMMNGDEIKTIDREGDFSDIEKIANISSNNNTKLAKIIRDIYTETHNPNIYVALDNGDKLDYEIQKGYRFDCKVLNHKAYINTDDGVCEKSNMQSLIAIFDHNVTYNEHAEIIGMLSNYASAMNKDVIIMAPYFDDIITNIIGSTVESFLQQRKIPNIMMMQVPLSMTIQRKYLSDIVLLTNSQVFDYGKVRALNMLHHNLTSPKDKKIEDKLFELEQYKDKSPQDIIETCIGHVDKFIIGNSYAIIKNFENVVNPDMYKNTYDEIKKEYEDLYHKAMKSSNILQKDYMDAQKRYIKFIGHMGIIKVGGTSELEKQCLHDTIDDAVLACKSAFEHGYIRGLNLAILSTIRTLYNECLEEQIDYAEQKDTNRLLILRMLEESFMTIPLAVMKNKYGDCDSGTHRIKIYTTEEDSFYTTMSLDQNGIINNAIDNGYDFDLVSESMHVGSDYTVINSVSTDIEILKAVISTLSLMLTSSQLISVNKMYDKKMGAKKVLDTKINERKELTKATIDTVISTIFEKLGIN